MSRPEWRRYLLGDLTEDERQRIEGTYFSSDDAFGDMLGAEDDLVEAFLAGTLAPGDRQRFERHFLATERGRSKVAIAAALSRTAAPARQRRWRSAAAMALAASLVVSVGAGWLVRELIVTRRQVRALEDRQRELVGDVARLTEQVESARSALPADSRTPRIAAFVLAGGMERGSQRNARLDIPATADVADLWLLVRGAAYPSYSASLQTVDGRELFSERALPGGAVDGRAAVLFRVPRGHLRAGTYVVTLSGERASGVPEPLEDFSFTVRFR